MTTAKCQLCNFSFCRLDMHLCTHDTTPAEYSNLFPDEKFSINFIKHQEKLKRKSLGIHGNKGKTAWNKGKKSSEKFRESIRESHWAKKPIEETHEIGKKMSINGTNSMRKINEDGKAFRMPKGYHSEEYKQKLKK